MINKLLALLIGLMCFLVVPAQNDSCNYTLTGTLSDDEHGEQLGYATIYVAELPKKSTQTNDRGQFIIKGLCSGTYTLVCSHLNCERTTVKVVVTGSTSIQIVMPHHEHTGSTVVVSDRSDRPPVSQTRSEISGRQLDFVRGQNLGQAVASLPGVTVVQTGGNIAKPVIHGMHSNRLLILNNGVRQEGQQWGIEHAPEIDPFIASRISVIKGASAVRYGSDAIAGVILIEPGDIRMKPGIQGEFNAVGFSNNGEGNVAAIWEHRPENYRAFAYRLQGTYRRGGNYATPNYRLNNTGVEEYNFSANAVYNHRRFDADIFFSQFNTTIGIFTGAHLGNITDLYEAINSAVPEETGGFSYQLGRPYQHVYHELLKARFVYYLNEDWKIRVQYARQYNRRFEYDKHGPRNDSLAALNRPDLSYELTTHSAELVAEHNMIRRMTGSFGVSGSYQFNTYAGRFFIPNYRAENVGAWWIERWNGDSILTLEAGIRYDIRHMQVFMWENNLIIRPQHQFQNFSTTLGAIVRYSDKLQFNLNGGRAWRAPAPNELYSNGLHHGAAAFELGDRNLETETAWNIIVTATWHEHDKLDVSITGYWHYFDNFIYATPQDQPIVSIRGAFPAFRFTQNNATLYGTDVQAGYYLNQHVQIISKAALLRAKNRDTQDWLIMMPADRGSAGINYHFNDKSNWSDLMIGGSAQYVNKQFRVPYGVDFAPPPNAYFLVGFEASANKKLKTGNLLTTITIINALNQSYRDYLNRFRYYADETGFNVRLHVKYSFELSKK
jgi:iron complex outermembrane receptor protein